jgi:hypothetical protein
MLSGRKYLFLIVLISTFLSGYLWHTKESRKESVETYISTPRIGDVYVMEKWFKGQPEKEMVYLKLQGFGQGAIYFYRSKMTSGGGQNDVFLNHYDTANIIVYTKKEIQEIKEGKWNVVEKQYTLIKEIRRN